MGFFRSVNFAFLTGLLIGTASQLFKGWYYSIIFVLIILFSVLFDYMYDAEFRKEGNSAVGGKK